MEAAKKLLPTGFNDEPPLVVTFEGESPIVGDSSREVWLNTLMHFGIENVYRCKPQNKNYDIVTTSSRQDVRDEARIGDYYVWCSINNKAKARAIRSVAEQLGVRVSVDNFEA